MDKTIALVSISGGSKEPLLQTNKLKYATARAAAACALLQTTNPP